MPVLVVILVRSFFGEFFRFLGVCITKICFFLIMDYQKEQQRLLKLMEDTKSEHDDDADETEDNLEIRDENSESEQDLDSDNEMR